MPPALPTLDQLQVLDAIVRTGSFAGAARELHRVPSAISYAVRTLEEHLQLELFDRSGHRAALTPAGNRVLELARVVLRDAETLASAATELQGGWEPELRVVVDGAVPLGPIMVALAALTARDVPTRVRLDVEFQDGVYERFQVDDGDVMILLDVEERAASLPTHLLPPLPMVLVVSASHPLAARSHVAVEALDAWPSLVVRDSARRYQRTPRETFLGTKRVLHVSDFHAKHAALRAGVGFGWMPRHLVAPDLEDGALVPVGLESGAAWTYAPRLVTRADRALGPAGVAFVATLLALASSDSSNVVMQNVSLS